MRSSTKIFKAIYLLTFIGIVFLSINLFLEIIALPDYLLPLMLVIGALMFFLEAMIQRKTRNDNV